ncbi:unnamed protein product [Aphanomyces euteiches]
MDLFGAKEDAEDEMWASICSLLHTTPVETPTTLEAGQRKTKRTRIYTNKAEVSQLEAEIQSLQELLAQTKRAALSRDDTSMWEQVAGQQRVEKNKALEENEQLRLAVKERQEYIDRLEKLLFKTPRWNALPDLDVSQVSLVLPVEPHLRAAAMHRIADQQYKRLQTVLVQAGALDLCYDMCKGESMTLGNQQLGFLACHLSSSPAHSGASLKYLVSAENAQDSWEHVDDKTVYNRYWTYRDSTTCHSNTVHKLYEEVNRSVIVFASVSDAIVVRQPTDVTDEMNGWWQFQPHPDDPEKSFLTIVTHSNISCLLEHKEVDAAPNDVKMALKEIFSARKKRVEDMPPPSYLKYFIERKQRFRKSMEKALQTAMHEYLAAKKSAPHGVTREITA